MNDSYCILVVLSSLFWYCTVQYGVADDYRVQSHLRCAQRMYVCSENAVVLYTPRATHYTTERTDCTVAPNGRMGGVWWCRGGAWRRVGAHTRE